MKQFENFTYTPRYQPDKNQKVEFDLRPLDLRTLYVVQSDIGKKKGIGVDGALAALEFSVVAWRGLEVEFSLEAKDAIFSQPGETRWAVWAGEIAAALWRKATLGVEAAKNS